MVEASSVSVKVFGEHFMLDGYHGDKDALGSKELVANCLEELPSKLSMSKLSEVQVYWAAESGEHDPGGWSGFVLIQESHISIHTFPARGFVSVDVYSCRGGLDMVFLEHYFCRAFSLQDVEMQCVQRGTRYPINNL